MVFGCHGGLLPEKDQLQVLVELCLRDRAQTKNSTIGLFCLRF
ncbi:hypothetical protein PATSB16_17410 [Pandoraea thiooxydans]|nr:hypothetical protein PATSB16_17410 [Pandoraea thiooxydans]